VVGDTRFEREVAHARKAVEDVAREFGPFVAWPDLFEAKKLRGGVRFSRGLRGDRGQRQRS